MVVYKSKSFDKVQMNKQTNCCDAFVCLFVFTEAKRKAATIFHLSALSPPPRIHMLRCKGGVMAASSDLSSSSIALEHAVAAPMLCRSPCLPAPKRSQHLQEQEYRRISAAHARVENWQCSRLEAPSPSSLSIDSGSVTSNEEGSAPIVLEFELHLHLLVASVVKALRARGSNFLAILRFRRTEDISFATRRRPDLRHAR
ncbi:hypothetical protein SCHPADRAFT_673828 [Schizopora paradoxa]|uniref:Uncharacterized protein n=1 Tax=Schizopora paradoxa TaxID=27342 RepID=A0A0H2RQ51_9AGAM|nr:hypothetical protein SCHPADRAFT_673828 [Schizopora paradoxa]